MSDNEKPWLNEPKKYYSSCLKIGEYGRIVDKIDIAISVKEAVQLLNITKYKIYRLIKNKKVKVLKIKNYYKIDKNDLDKIFSLKN